MGALPNAYPEELRQRVVRAYDAGRETGAEIAEQFAVSLRTLERWVGQRRATGDLTPRPRGGAGGHL